MSEKLTIIPYGSLRVRAGLSPGGALVHAIRHGQPLSAVLKTMGIPVDRVQLVMVNHRPAGLETEVGTGDRVALFPGEYPIFADWHAFRRRAVSRHTASSRVDHRRNG